MSELRKDISVIMSVYNAEKYLDEAINSILVQTFPYFEFIIVNDGATDNSLSVIKRYEKKDKRIRIISQENTGVTKATNRALECAVGEYIAIMDADDISVPDRFEKQITFLNDNAKYVAVGSFIEIIDNSGMPICPFSTFSQHHLIDQAHMRVEGGAISNAATMFRRSALKAINYYREEMHPAQDIDLFLRLAEIGQLTNVPQVLYKYRMHHLSIGNSNRVKQFTAAIRAVKDAHVRRGLYFDENKFNKLIHEYQQGSLSKRHAKWAWWALGAGNKNTARKHAWIAFCHSPFSLQNFKVLICSVRGY